jgi:hypothetical protein
MAVDEFKVRDLERRIRELENVVKKLRNSKWTADLGSRENPLRYLYLQDPRGSNLVKISNDGGSALRFERSG